MQVDPSPQRIEWRTRFEKTHRRARQGMWRLELVAADRLVLVPAGGGTFASERDAREYARGLSAALPRAEVQRAKSEAELRQQDEARFRERLEQRRMFRAREREILERVGREGETEALQQELDELYGRDPEEDEDDYPWDDPGEEEDGPRGPPVWVMREGARPSALLVWGWRRVVSTHGMLHIDDVTELIERLRRVGPSLAVAAPPASGP